MIDPKAHKNRNGTVLTGNLSQETQSTLTHHSPLFEIKGTSIKVHQPPSEESKAPEQKIKGFPWVA